MVILIAIVVILLFSFFLSLRSLRGMKLGEKEVRRVKNELARGRVIFARGVGQDH